MEFTLPTVSMDFFRHASPTLALALFSLIVLLQAISKRFAHENAIRVSTYTALFVAGACAVGNLGLPASEFLTGGVISEGLANFGQLLILLVAILVCLAVSATHLSRVFYRGELMSIFLMALMGMLVLVSADDVISAFIGLELSSIGVYALVGYVRVNRLSQEGAIKYLLLGAFGTALFLFGVALLYAGTGTMRISEMVAALSLSADEHWIRLGGLMTMVGLGFKLALAPFHLWAPDAYESAPTSITAFMATASKITILVLMLRFIAEGLSVMSDVWLPQLFFLAAVSMILGNVMALVQSSLKRMLAYSSVAHSGYMAVALCAMGSGGNVIPVSAVLFYLSIYSLVSLGAFFIIMWLESDGRDNLQLDDLAGMAKRHPWACAALSIFMFAFSGLPPTAGFISKFFVFTVAIRADLVGLVLIGVLGSVISLFYYLRVIVKMYMNEPALAVEPFQPNASRMMTAMVGSIAVLIILFGTVFPGSAMSWMEAAAKSMSLH